MIETLIIYVTLVALNVCHWLGDYTHLSTNWMLSAKRYGKPFLPILAHAMVHTVLFFIAILALHGLEDAILAACIQLPTHFVIDTMKGRMNGWFPRLEDIKNKFHWYVFGIDQMCHHLVIIFTTFMVCS